MADHHDTDHVHGSMDVRAQEKTFHGFIRLAVWAVVVIFAVLIIMALANA